MRFFRRGFADLQKNIVTPREIASRICASQLLLTRWAIEGSRTDQTMEAYETLQQTVQLKGLQHMTEMEKKWMDMPLGQWDPQMLFDLSFKWESLGILLWSLKIIDKVPYPSEMFPRQVLYQSTSLIPAFPETYDTFVEYFESGPGSDPEHFVSQSELSFLVDQTEAWFWRSKAQQVLELKHSLQEDTPQTKEAKKSMPTGLKQVMQNIESAIDQASQRAAAEGYCQRLENDFATHQNTVYSKLDDHSLRDIELAVESRMAALCWLSKIIPWDFERGTVPFLNPLSSIWKPE